MADKMNEITAAAGFQIPLGIKQRKKKVDEMLVLCEDINEGDVLTYFNNLDDRQVDTDCKDLDEANFASLAERIREFVLRQVVRNRIKEVVRKKAGGGGYVLYSPNQGKKKNPKPVGNFPTKLGAKKAELARFPPKDPKKLARLRHEVERLMKDPKKRADAERRANKEKGSSKAVPKFHKGDTKPHKHKKEDVLRSTIASALHEALFHEDKTGSDWDDQLSRLSKQAIQSDGKFQQLQRNIQKRTEKILADSFNAIAKSIDRKKVKLKNFGIKHSEEKGKTYLAFSATMDNVEVAPIYIYVEAGTPKIEVSDQARAAMTKADPGTVKLFRAELVTVQERVLDNMDDLEKAIAARDKYLDTMEDEVDEFVADLTPLQLSLLKNVLVKKYRKVQ